MVNFHEKEKSFQVEVVQQEVVVTQRKEEKVFSKQEMKWLKTDFPIYVKNLSNKRKLVVLLLEVAVAVVQAEVEGAEAEVVVEAEVFLQEQAVQVGAVEAEVPEAVGVVAEEEVAEEDVDRIIIIFIFYEFSRFFIDTFIYYKRCVEILIFCLIILLRRNAEYKCLAPK